MVMIAIDFSKKDTLSSKERLQALVSGRSLDRVPFNPLSFGFSAKVYGIDRGKFYRNPDLAFAAGMHLLKRYPWINARPIYGWADRGAWEFGGKIVWPDNGQYAAPLSQGPVVSDPEEIEALLDPDPVTAGMNPLVARFNAISREHGFPASLPAGTPTTASSGVVGRDNFLRWLIRYPEVLHKLQRKVTDFILRDAELTIDKYGGENCSLFCGVPMESNQLISPKAFETFCKPYIKEIMGYFVSKGVRSIIVHLCGNHTDNLPQWADIPLPPRTVFSIGHEMDLEKTGQVIGKDHILAGNINSSILQLGSKSEVKAEVKRCLEAGMKHPGGFILMPACELPPETPLENMEALAEALYEYGYY